MKRPESFTQQHAPGLSVILFIVVPGSLLVPLLLVSWQWFKRHDGRDDSNSRQPPCIHCT